MAGLAVLAFGRPPVSWRLPSMPGWGDGIRTPVHASDTRTKARSAPCGFPGLSTCWHAQAPEIEAHAGEPVDKHPGVGRAGCRMRLWGNLISWTRSCASPHQNGHSRLLVDRGRLPVLSPNVQGSDADKSQAHQTTAHEIHGNWCRR